MEDNIILKGEDLELKHDIPAESGIVGTVLKNPDFISHVDFMNPNMFCDDKFSALYWAVSELVEDGVDEVDDLSIVQKLTSDGLVEIFDGDVGSIRERVNKLKMLGTDNIGEFIRRCRVVATIDYREKIMSEMVNTIKYVKETKDDINDVNYNVNEKIANVGNNFLVHNDTPLIGDVVESTIKEIQERASADGIVGIPTKFPFVNNYFTYEPGELIVIGGQKKAGKSVVIMNEAYHKASQGIPTLVLDTEMSTTQWMTRLISLITGITMRNLKSGIWTKAMEDKILEAKKEIKQMPLAHVYLVEKFSGNWSFRDLYSIVKSYQHKMDVKFLCYDYIKQNKVSGTDVAEHNYLGDITNYLKNDIIGRLGITGLAGAQMSDYEDRLSDSAKIARYASTIFYWKKKAPQEIIGDGIKSGTHKLFIDFNRLGRQFDDMETEYINMYADLDRMIVKQCASQPLEEDGDKPWDR